MGAVWFLTWLEVLCYQSHPYISTDNCPQIIIFNTFWEVGSIICLSCPQEMDPDEPDIVLYAVHINFII